MGLQSLLQEEKKATEDPYLEMDAAKEILVESHEEQVGYSLADVSEQILCTFWLLYCISLLHFVQEGHQHRQPTVTNQGLSFVARRLLSGIQASYDRFRGRKGKGKTRLDSYLKRERVIPDLMTGEDIKAVEIPAGQRQHWEPEIPTEKGDRRAFRVQRKTATHEALKKPAGLLSTPEAQPSTSPAQKFSGMPSTAASLTSSVTGLRAYATSVFVPPSCAAKSLSCPQKSSWGWCICAEERGQQALLSFSRLSACWLCCTTTRLRSSQT